MRYLPLLLTLLATPALAQSGGFTTDELTASAREAVQATAPDAATTARALARSERIRAVLAVAMDRASAHLSPAELRAITTALGPPSEDRDILLSWLMRGGTVASAGPELTGIYNPFADGWLVLSWAEVGGVPRLTSAALVTGEELRGGLPAPLDRPDMPYAQALVARQLAALDGFGAVDADLFALFNPAVRVGETELVLARARAEVGALAQWSRANAPALANLARTIDRASDPALLPFPDRVRDALSPAALVQTPGGAELVLQSPAYPARSLFARFPDAGEPELFALDLIPLAGSNAL